MESLASRTLKLDVVPEGSVIAGKYAVEHVLGEGSSGIVVAATHRGLHTRVAVKLLRPERADAVMTERLFREARLLAGLHNEHIVRVMDVGHEDRFSFIVMEYLHGESLAGIVQRRGRLPVEECVDWIVQAASGLAEAHAAGIVHRDVKPANLFLTQRVDGEPLVKVVDFGVAKSPAKEAAFEASLTHTAEVMGSPLYMSPEQIDAPRDVTHRTDIWSLGVTLYRLLTDKGPFSGSTLSALLSAIVHQPPRPLRTERPDVPRGLESALLRALEKDPSRRFSSMAEFAEALAPYGSTRAHASLRRIVRATPSNMAPKPNGRNLSKPDLPVARMVGELPTEPSEPLSSIIASSSSAMGSGRSRAILFAIVGAAALILVGLMTRISLPTKGSIAQNREEIKAAIAVPLPLANPHMRDIAVEADATGKVQTPLRTHGHPSGSTQRNSQTSRTSNPWQRPELDDR